MKNTAEDGVAVNGDAPSTHHETLELEGLDCPDCAASLEKAVAGIVGVASARISFATSTLRVEYSPPFSGRDRILSCVREAGYRVREQAQGTRPKAQGATAERSAPGTQDSAPSPQSPIVAFWRSHHRSGATAVSGVSLIAGFLLLFWGVSDPLPQALLGLGVLVGGYSTARSALFALRGRQADMNVLMSAAVLGALAIGEWTEAASVVFLFSLANALESYTLDRTRRSLRSLLALSPSQATVLRDEEQVTLPVEEISVGDLLLIRPGERIAMDGVVVAGSSSVNQAPITGESLPLEKGVGDEVFAGTINQRGSLEVRATRASRDNTLARIIHLVEEAQSQKAVFQKFVDRFAGYYTPMVIALAAALSVVPPLFFGASFEVWFYRALVLLIIACPCALVISTPVSIASAIASASRNGVLFKGGSYLEAIGSIPAVAFDKTGTLTLGHPEVTDVVVLDGHDRQEVLAVAAGLEARSEHHLAEAILRQAGLEGVEVPPVSEFQAMPGLGAEGSVKGVRYFLGNARWVREKCGATVPIPPLLETLQQEGKTVVMLGSGDRLLGMLAVADRLRPESRQALADLHAAGVQRLVLLTGDNRRTAAAIAEEAGIDEFQAELLPEEKRSAVDTLLVRYGRVAMVGDGVNDAPALARATVGIAMGAAGTDAALETADVALMADDLSKLPWAVRLSHRTARVIRQNVAVSLLVKLAFVVMASAGWANLWMAVLADMGTSLLVIANGMRLLRRKL